MLNLQASERKKSAIFNQKQVLKFLKHSQKLLRNNSTKILFEEMTKRLSKMWEVLMQRGEVKQAGAVMCTRLEAA